MYRLSKKISFALRLSASNISWLSTEIESPYNNNNIN